MKSTSTLRPSPPLRLAALALLLSTFITPLSTFVQGTAFTCQGFLTVQSAPANGSYDYHEVVQW